MNKLSEQKQALQQTLNQLKDREPTPSIQDCIRDISDALSNVTEERYAVNQIVLKTAYRIMNIIDLSGIIYNI